MTEEVQTETQNPVIGGVEIRISELRSAGPRFWGLVTSLLVIIAMGFIAWGYQLKNGLVVTGMRDIFAWGLYIQNFIFFVGLAAGGLIIYSSVNLAGVKKFAPLNKIAVLQASTCTLLAMSFIFPDLGNPKNAINFLFSPNVYSIFVFDALILNIYFILTLVDMYMMLSGKIHKGNREMTLTLISLPAAIGIHSITAWILGLARARELWHTALMAPLFISSAIASGLALLILMVLLIRRYTDMKFDDDVFESMAQLTAWVVAVDLFFLLAESLTTMWRMSSTPGHMERFMIFVTGKYAPIFLSEVFLFGVLPFFLLAWPKTRKNVTLNAVASVFILMGIFSKRFFLLGSGLAYSPWGWLGVYWPTLTEVMVTAGMWSIGILVVTLAMKLFDMEVEIHEEEEEEEAPPVEEAAEEGAGPAQCGLCDAKFDSMDECCAHAEKEHAIAQESCDMACESLGGGGGGATCGLCDAEFSSMDECCEHAEKEHAIAKESCDMACEESAGGGGGGGATCGLCDAEFSSMDECCEHAEKDHQISKDQCDMACE